VIEGRVLQGSTYNEIEVRGVEQEFVTADGQLIRALDLCRRKRRRTGGVARDGVDVPEDRTQLLFDRRDQLRHAPHREACDEDDADLGDGERDRRHRDDAEEDLTPFVHTLSRARAC